MDLKEYQRLAMRTANMNISRELILANRALGLAGEAAEFSGMLFQKRAWGDKVDSVSVIKELGDVMWYAATMAEAVGLQIAALKWQSRRPLNGVSLDVLTLGLNTYAGAVADIIKKHVTHGHALDPMTVGANVGAVVYFVDELAKTHGVTLSEICERNIEKLRKRYPEGFDEERSKQRASSDN